MATVPPRPARSRARPADDPAAKPPGVPVLAADLPERALDGLGLEDESRIEGLELVGALEPGFSARSATIEDCRIRGALPGAQLHDLHLHDCELVGADLANVDLRGSALTRLTLTRCRLTGAQLVEASIQDLTLVDCRLDFAVLALARMDRVLLRGCDLREASLEQTQMRDVRFENCDLSRAMLGQAQLLRVELHGCRLDGLRAIGDLRGAAMPWPDVVAHAGAFAQAVGVSVLEDEDPE
jgi:uncharacterized protein YjbI with pentapeptide repeats